jgi:hypothetical protein
MSAPTPVYAQPRRNDQYLVLVPGTYLSWAPMPKNSANPELRIVIHSSTNRVYLGIVNRYNYSADTLNDRSAIILSIIIDDTNYWNPSVVHMKGNSHRKDAMDLLIWAIHQYGDLVGKCQFISPILQSKYAK